MPNISFFKSFDKADEKNTLRVVGGPVKVKKKDVSQKSGS